MDILDIGKNLPPEILLQIIHFQQRIIRLGPDFTAVMAEAAQGAQDLVGSDGAVIEIAEGSELIYRAASTSSLALLGSRVPLQGSLSGACIKSGTPLICHDSENDPRVDRMATRKVGVASMIVSPLNFNGSCVGVLKVFSKASHAFGTQDIQIVDIISSTISASMYLAAKTESSELFYIATHDFLTGLANRALFHDRLQQRITQSKRMGDQFAIIMADMDKLKQVNDQYGHKAGDSAIKLFAEHLLRYARSSDTVARIGGDEFAILLYQVENDAGVRQACQRLIDILDHGDLIEGTDIQAQASIGHATFPQDGKDIEALMDRADQSMYANKRTRTPAPPHTLIEGEPII